MAENSPAFQRWDRGPGVPSPEGTAELVALSRLRDSTVDPSAPGVETPGYFQESLRDKNTASGQHL